MRRWSRLVLCLFLAVQLTEVSAQDTKSYTTVISTESQEYTVGPSTPTPQQLKQMKANRPRKPPIRQLKAMEHKFQRAIKKTNPNPNVRRLSASPLPPNAPVMPPGPQLPPQPTAGERFIGEVSKIMTKSWGPNIFVWLPALSTDPNAGPTVGVLPVFVLADPATHHIRHLLAPSYTYNSLFGQTGTMRYYWYPSDTSQLVTIGSYSEHTNRELKARYENTSLMDGVLYLRTEGFYDVDASRRFFGTGPASSARDESGYTSEDSVGLVSLGINFFHSWRAMFGQRFRRMATDDTIIPDIPDITTTFPGQNGIGTQNTVANEFRLVWDSRDFPITPSRGSSGEMFFEKTSQAMGSNSDFIRYGLQGVRFFNWENPRYITVLHGLYDWANGPDIPFYELPSLGGRETLRGYGDGRFEDRGRVVMNVEQRITFGTIELMGIRTNFELAPFFDLGSVFPTLPEVQFKYLRPVWGGAFRAAVKPNVVGDVEVGMGNEGPAVFVDINYPY